MPRIFAYGSLQQRDVQLSTFGRELNGVPDALTGCALSTVPIDDPRVATALGKTHHANVRFNGLPESRVPGMVFEIADAELALVDEYERADAYHRVLASLASGGEAWVYVHWTHDAP